MITLTKINNEELFLNPDLIENISQSPDTRILLISGKTIMVKESPEEIVESIVKFRQRIYLQPDIIRHNTEE